MEHDADEIWANQLATAREALATAGLTGRDIAAIGITNQRETVVVCGTGRTGRAHPSGNRLAGPPRRPPMCCERLRAAGPRPDLVRSQHGAACSIGYFSGTKLALESSIMCPVRTGKAAQRGELAFGTIDSFLLWRLTGRRTSMPPIVTNAVDGPCCSTSMPSVWDDELLKALHVPDTRFAAAKRA